MKKLFFLLCVTTSAFAQTDVNVTIDPDRPSIIGAARFASAMSEYTETSCAVR